MKLLAAAATALTLFAGAATATSFDLLVETGTTTGPRTATATYDFGELFIDDDLLEVSIVAVLAADGTFDPANATSTNLSLFDFVTGESLAGELVNVAYESNTILALFETTTDDFAGAPWGDLVRATVDIPSVSWGSGVSLTDLADFSASAGTPATVTIDAVAPIPLPATLPLLAGGIALVAVARRRAA